MKLFKLIESATGNEIADLMIEGEVEILSDTYHLEEVPEAGLTLDELKAYYIREVDLFAGEVRARFMARGYGQEITYVEKRIDALNYLNAGSPADSSAFPFISAEATSTGQEPATVAAMIIGRSDALRSVGSSIEAQRTRGGDQITAAADAAEATAAKDFAIASLDVHRMS